MRRRRWSRRRRDEATALAVVVFVLGLFAAFSLADHGDRHGPPAFIGQYGFPPGQPDDRPPAQPPDDSGKPGDRPPPHSGGPPHDGNPPGAQDPQGGGTPPGQSASFSNASFPLVDYPATPLILLMVAVLGAGVAFRLFLTARRAVTRSTRRR